MQRDRRKLITLINWASHHRTPVSIAIHAAIFTFSLLLAFGLATNFNTVEPWLTETFLKLVLPVVIVKLIVFQAMGVWRASWRYVGLRDLLSVTIASVTSTFLVVLSLYAIENLAMWRLHRRFFDPELLPDSVFLIDWAATIALVAVARISIRLYHEEYRDPSGGGTVRALIVGAGDAGEALLRELLRMTDQDYVVVGFLDENVARIGNRIHGVEVLGGPTEIDEVLRIEPVDEVLIAMPRATQRQIREIVEQCQGTNVRVRIIPQVADLIDGRVQVSQLREVSIEDLLGRDPVELDSAAIDTYLRDRCVLVTGAGGSIGSEMCRQIARFRPALIALVEQAENNLFEIERELRARFPELQTIPLVCDIADAGRVDAIFHRARPSAVFHAAAHKHVPMMELNPGEAIKNNVGGTRVIADAAARHGVEKVVMISTDKAVNPSSIMGCSKRVAEMYVQELSDRSDTQFVTVRFGNVLGSSGSVIPIFKQQIAAGGPVTVTHPDMKRYFMTIPEAAQLVLQAGAMGNGGEIFVLDMGQPVRIIDLARDLITLSGLRPDEDIEIVFSGVRPGEKLYEELSIEGEDVSRTSHPKIGIWRRRPDDFNRICRGIDDLIAVADQASLHDIREVLQQIVPEYVPDPLADPNGAATPTGTPASPSAVSIN